MMKLKLAFLLVTAGLIGLASCHRSDPNQTEERPEPKNKYAELRLGSNGKIQMLIRADVWRGEITPMALKAMSITFFVGQPFKVVASIV